MVEIVIDQVSIVRSFKYDGIVPRGYYVPRGSNKADNSSSNNSEYIRSDRNMHPYTDCRL